MAGEDTFVPLRQRTAKKVLQNLDAFSGTGPDLLPARLLKECAHELALPVVLLCRLVLQQGWPNCWRTHWIHPIFKKGSVWKPGQYRGVHLTSQLSKVVERCFAPHLLGFFVDKGLLGRQPVCLHQRQRVPRRRSFFALLLAVAAGVRTPSGPLPQRRKRSL